MADHDTLISNFCELTNASLQQATEYLTASEWDLDDACAAYFNDADEGAAYTGPRTLDGRPAPQHAAASSSTSKKPQKRTGLATLSSISGGGGHGHSHDDDDDDDGDDDERRGPRDLFAGGEKSGLAVQDPAQRSSDPRKLINDIVASAKANAKKEDTEPAPAAARPSRYFGGGGHTLGGDGVESRRVGEPAASPAPSSATAAPADERVLHIWVDGFSIDDGPLRRFDDPANQADLQMIRQGRAPLHLWNVRPGERVDVKLQQHQEEYRPLPKVYRPFGGEGRRLGSPVPGVTAALAPPAAAPAAAPAPASSTPRSSVDESQPTLNLRIQLPDGTRLPARFNTTQTVGDVYDFIGRASSSVSARPWVLATTFPNKDHTDKSLVLGELPEFKRGGTAVVKWA